MEQGDDAVQRIGRRDSPGEAGCSAEFHVKRKTLDDYVADLVRALYGFGAGVANPVVESSRGPVTLVHDLRCFVRRSARASSSAPGGIYSNWTCDG